MFTNTMADMETGRPAVYLLYDLVILVSGHNLLR